LKTKSRKLKRKYETNEKERNKRKWPELSVSFVIFRLVRILLLHTCSDNLEETNKNVLFKTTPHIYVNLPEKIVGQKIAGSSDNVRFSLAFMLITLNPYGPWHPYN
jgi:hypothetical protein